MDTFKFYLKTILLLTVSAATMGLSYDSAHWRKLADPGYEPHVLSVAADLTNPSLIYFGTDKALYAYERNSRNLKLLLKLSGEPSAINDIHLNPDEPDTLLIAADTGLFQSNDRGKTWERVFFHSDELSRQAQSVKKIGSVIYLGTKKGLFYKKAADSQWQKFKGELGQSAVTHIEKSGDYIFATNHQAVFRIDTKNDYIKVFSLGVTHTDEFEGKEMIRDLKVMSTPESSIIAGSSKGVFTSTDQGRTWQPIVLEHIALEFLTALIPQTSHGSCSTAYVSCIRLLLATSRGAFLYENGRTTPIYKGLATNEINDVALGLRGEVYAATNDGLYVRPLMEALPNFNVAEAGTDYKRIQSEFENEPDIADVHQMAVNYAELSPDKIKDWRRQAKLKAILPSLSAGIERAGTDRYHWDTGQSPDVLQEGRDYLDWDVSLSWDLSDLIWSTDQTTIDSRSKLMVELREDVLDQITRLYFERRRLQIELLAKNFDQGAEFDKRMRIEELTALIDALTGGEFSRSIQAGSR